MADKAHEWTDEKIGEIERRLSRIYGRAEKNVGQKWKAYMDEIGGRVGEAQKAYDAAKAAGDRELMRSTGRALSKVKKELTITDSHYRELTRQTALEISRVNETAAAYINGQLPEVYARNYNQIAAGVNGQIRGYSFELVDASTIRNLALSDKTLLPYKTIDTVKDVRWNVQKVNSEVLQGILSGDSMDKIAGRLSSVLGMNETSAIRNARTSVTSAENKGRIDMLQDAEDKGVKTQKGWLATNDSRTRDSHAELNGVFVDIDDEFDNGLEYPGDPNGDPSEVYNCFIGDTKIASNSEIVRSYKHEYEGRLITIKTSGGVNFTCTPNHPILTLSGWVAAESLKNGDDLIVTFGENEFTFGIDPDVNHAFPRIDAVHKLFDKLGGKRTCALGVNFHGDIAASDVEIIAHERLLRNGLNSNRFNSINKFNLERTYKTLSGKCSFIEHFRRIRTSAFGLVRRKCKALSFRFWRFRHSEIHGLRPIALLDSGRVKALYNDASGDVKLICECLDGFSGMIFADNIISVDFSSGRSHVYNLQTQNGYYFVNSIIPQDKEKCNGIFAIAKNCRCTLVYKVVGFERR